MSQRSRTLLGLVVSASVVVVLAALIVFARAEREWPGFPVYPANLDFGPVFKGELLEQTVVAPPTPLREIRFFAVEPWPAAVIVRVRDAEQSSSDLLFESSARVRADGSIPIRVPGTVDMSGRLLRIQVINPLDSSTPLTLRASRTDPYPEGRAAARDDVGEGNVDLVLEAWRRVTPRSLAIEVWRAHAPGATFVILTTCLLGGVALHRLWRWTARWPKPVFLTASLLLLAAGLLAARVGLAWLAPWSA
ncbi:MAG: hypothetical protein F4Y02_18005 [Chloroflexi bacterium]|nr:hypothetical protein [Chloroflexota bacterium]